MECSTNARLLFIGIWNFCDDEGRHPLAPKQIKALVFPGDGFTADEIAGMLDELSANDLIRPYAVEGKEYFEVTGWQHQKIDRPQKAKYPAPLADNSPNPRDGIQRGGDRNTDKNSETIVSGEKSPPATVHPIDARTALFRDGLDDLRALTGKPDGPARALLGKWLKANGDDAKALHGVLQRAVDARPADPVSWIEKAIRPRPAADDPMRNVL